MADVLVLAEHSEGTVRKATLELLTLARRLGRPTALLFGTPDEALVTALGEHGAETVYAVADPALEDYLVAPKAQALAEVVRRTSPVAVLATAGREGLEIAARAAVHLDSGIITGATDVVAGDDGPLVSQLVSAGSLTSRSQVTRGTPIITVRPNAVAPEPAPAVASVETVEVQVDDAARGSTIVARTPKASTGRPALADAAVVVAGGRGMGSAEAFAEVERVADALGGAVAASRAATDEGWYDHDFQVGQTGKTVAPQLYLAAGISGAIQHRAGMQGSKTIVAINKDPQAPIFGVAHLGVVGDAHVVLPALAEEIERRRT